MKRVIYPMLIVFITATSSLAASEQGIEIKGLRIGMTKEDFKAKFGGPPYKRFTIAGIPSNNEYIPPKFRDDKLEMYFFAFSPSYFTEMLQAIGTKFPQMKCTESKIKNEFGAVFDQVKCDYNDDKSTLTLIRYLDLKTSALTLSTPDYFKGDSKEKADERLRDL